MAMGKRGFRCSIGRRRISVRPVSGWNYCIKMGGAASAAGN
jgi:hypothetical protein